MKLNEIFPTYEFNMTTILDTPFIFLDPLSIQLEQVEALLAAQVDGSRSSLEAALARLIAAGGKRIRPRLALLIGGLLAAEPDPLRYLAAAIEMLHTATLIHDDLIDGASLRRGVETFNAHGPAAASVLVGDFAFTRAARLVVSTESIPAIDMFTAAMATIVDGELTQLARPRGISNREEYFGWIGAKTAALFELASGAPALLSVAGEQAFAAARRFGYGIGMAFQIVDDVLDFTSDPVKLGKPVGSDLRQGVITLPALIYLDDHPGDPDLGAVIHRESLDGPALDGLIDRIRRSEAINRSLEMAYSFIGDALDDLACLPEGPERFALAEIAREIVTRDK
jgi:geranylgeranyl pyrophosphate synthase